MPSPKLVLRKSVDRRRRRRLILPTAILLVGVLVCVHLVLPNAADRLSEDRLLNSLLYGDQQADDDSEMNADTSALRTEAPAAAAASATKFVPYIFQGRTANVPVSSNPDLYDEKPILKSISSASIQPIPSTQQNWVLAKRLTNHTRNHDNIIFDVNDSDRQVLVIVLGRWSESIQWFDLQSGKRNITMVTGYDPAGKPLGNLNHVYSVVVDSLSTPSQKEIWLPCGFHGHQINREQSSKYARIVNLGTMTVQVGPELPFAGGACVAAAIHVHGPDKPAHICTFGGTQGSHDTGTFLPYSACYDREAEKWHFPFGRMPFGFDHGSIVHLPPGVCDPSDPARILIFNFRTETYGKQRPEMLAFDIPSDAWSPEEDYSMDAETPGKWYIFANISHSGAEDEANAPRDASGLAIANNWRNFINFGGIHYHGHHNFTEPDGSLSLRFTHRRYSTIRSFDVCSRTWSKVGDMGVRVFAVQTGVSANLNLAITCGGHIDAKRNNNNPWCIASRIPGMQLQANQGCSVTNGQIPGTIFEE